jgi:hypothetical protein
MVRCPATFSTQVRTPSQPGRYWRASCHTSVNTASVMMSAMPPWPNRQAAESRTNGDSTFCSAWNAFRSPATVSRTYSSRRSAPDPVVPVALGSSRAGTTGRPSSLNVSGTDKVAPSEQTKP